MRIPEVITGNTRFHTYEHEAEYLWNTIGSDKYVPSLIKNTDIRNPAIRYVHKIISETYFAKKESGGVKEYELTYLTSGLRHLLGMRFKNGAGIAERTLNPIGLFVNTLLKIQEHGWTHRDSKPVLKIGGMITPILLARGIKLKPYGRYQPAATL